LIPPPPPPPPRFPREPCCSHCSMQGMILSDAFALLNTFSGFRLMFNSTVHSTFEALQGPVETPVHTCAAERYFPSPVPYVYNIVWSNLPCTIRQHKDCLGVVPFYPGWAVVGHGLELALRRAQPASLFRRIPLHCSICVPFLFIIAFGRLRLPASNSNSPCSCSNAGRSCCSATHSFRVCNMPRSPLVAGCMRSLQFLAILQRLL